MKRHSISQTPLSFEKKLFWIFVLLLGTGSVVAFHLASFIDIDFWDGHNFLIQSLRLIDPEYAKFPFDSHRPRTVILFLTLFNVAWKTLFGTYPTLPLYHAMMVVFAIGAVLVWAELFRRIWSPAVAWVAMSFFLIQQMWIHYAPFLLTDLLACFFIGAVLLVFHFSLQHIGKKRERKKWLWLAAGLGALGPIAGLTKNHFSLFLPSLLVGFFLFCWILPAFKKWKREKELLHWLGLCLLVFLISFEILTQTVGQWGYGVWEHFRLLLLQAEDQVHSPVTAKIYVENLFWIYGPLFWILSGVSLWALARHHKKIFPKTLPAKMTTYCVGGITILYLALTQAIHHREVRYVLPELPGLLGFIALGAVGYGNQLKQKHRPIWVGLWGIACLFPLYRTIKDVKVFYQDPIYQASKSNSAQLWSYFNAPSRTGIQCPAIFTCQFHLRSRTPFELSDDLYYRRFDYLPQYQYNTAKHLLIQRCQVAQKFQSTLVEMLQKVRNPEQICFATLERPENLNRIPYLVVAKPLRTHLTEKVKESYLSELDFDAVCARGREGKFHCYEYQRFFGR